MQSPRSPSLFLGGPTSFSSVTDPTLHRRGWRSTLARESPVISPRQRAASFNADASDNDDAASRGVNVDELKWFEHRWLNKHGKHSQLKEFREKMMLMRRWFESLDADGSGEVGLNELEDPLVSVGLARSRDDVQKLIDEVDREGKGEVTFDEFLHLMYPKKVKRQRKRAPLHQPKARAGADNQALVAPAAKSPSAKVSSPRPSSPLGSPRAPVSPSSPGSRSYGVGSPRRRHVQAAQASTTDDESTRKPKVNPVVKLFEDLQSGKLGDLAIPFPVLITAYRRRMLLNAHMADDPTARSLGTSVLQALESSRREIVPLSDHRRSESIAAIAAHALARRRTSVVAAPHDARDPQTQQQLRRVSQSRRASLTTTDSNQNTIAAPSLLPVLT